MRNTLLLIAWLVPAMHFAQTLDSPNVAIGYQDQAESFMIEEDYETAAVFYKKAANLFQKLDMKKHYYSCLTSLAKAAFLAGSYEEAKKYAKEALWDGLKAFGKYDENSAATAHLLAQIYEETAQFEKAEIVHKTGIGIHKSLYGADHPSVANSYFEFGNYYSSQGNFQEAIHWHEKALVIRQNKFGEDHLDVAKSLFHLADLQLQMKNLKDASVNHQRALAIRQNRLEDDHSDVQLSLLKNAQTLWDLGKSMLLVEDSTALKGAYAHFCNADQLLDQVDNVPFNLENNFEAFLYIALGLYDSAIEVGYQLFQKTKDEDYITQALIFSDKVKAWYLAKHSSFEHSFSCISTSDSSSFDMLEIDLKELRDQYLHPNKALLAYCQSGPNMHIFTISESGVWWDKTPVDSLLNVQIQNFKSALLQELTVNHSDSLNMAYQLFVNSAFYLNQKLIQPALAHLPVTTESLVIVPEINLGMLPFGVLLKEMPSKNEIGDFQNLPYLLRSYNLSYMSFLGTLTPCMEPAKHDVENLKKEFISINPPAKYRSSDLESKIQGTVKAGGSSQAYVLKTVNQSEASRWSNDQFWDWPGIFCVQNCSAAVVELWPRSIQEETDWNQQYYAQLKQGLDQNQALRTMKLEYLKAGNLSVEKGHPFHWAGFILVGNPAKILPKTRTKWQWVLLSAGGLFFVAFYFFQKKIKRPELFNSPN